MDVQRMLDADVVYPGEMTLPEDQRARHVDDAAIPRGLDRGGQARLLGDVDQEIGVAARPRGGPRIDRVREVGSLDEDGAQSSRREMVEDPRQLTVLSGRQGRMSG